LQRIRATPPLERRGRGGRFSRPELPHPQRRQVQGRTAAANIWLRDAVGLGCCPGDIIVAAIIFGFTVAIVTRTYLIRHWLARPAARLTGKSTQDAIAGATSED